MNLWEKHMNIIIQQIFAWAFAVLEWPQQVSMWVACVLPVVQRNNFIVSPAAYILYNRDAWQECHLHHMKLYSINSPKGHFVLLTHVNFDYIVHHIHLHITLTHSDSSTVQNYCFHIISRIWIWLDYSVILLSLHSLFFEYYISSHT